MAAWSKIKAGWMKFALKLGQFNTAVLLTLVYFLTIGPISLIGRLFRAKFIVRRAKAEDSFAVPIETTTSTMERAHKQF